MTKLTVVIELDNTGAWEDLRSYGTLSAVNIALGAIEAVSEHPGATTGVIRLQYSQHPIGTWKLSKNKKKPGTDIYE